jgi:hypothetical protein
MLPPRSDQNIFHFSALNTAAAYLSETSVAVSQAALFEA